SPLPSGLLAVAGLPVDRPAAASGIALDRLDAAVCVHEQAELGSRARPAAATAATAMQAGALLLVELGVDRGLLVRRQRHDRLLAAGGQLVVDQCQPVGHQLGAASRPAEPAAATAARCAGHPEGAAAARAT